jgi:hypothetical protein
VPSVHSECLPLPTVTNSNKLRHLQRHRWLREGGSKGFFSSSLRSNDRMTAWGGRSNRGWRRGEEARVGGSSGRGWRRPAKDGATALGSGKRARTAASSGEGAARPGGQRWRAVRMNEMAWMVFPIPISSARLVMGTDEAPRRRAGVHLSGSGQHLKVKHLAWSPRREGPSGQTNGFFEASQKFIPTQKARCFCLSDIPICITPIGNTFMQMPDVVGGFFKKLLVLIESTVHLQFYREDFNKFKNYKKQLQTHCPQNDPKLNSNLHKRHNILLKLHKSTPRHNFNDERPSTAILRRVRVEHKSDAAGRRADDPTTHQPLSTPPSGMLSQNPSIPTPEWPYLFLGKNCVTCYFLL